jgi:endonuclease/exonuclease/phosphatase family metal-dependent hydrolase
MQLVGLSALPAYSQELRVASYNVWGLPSPLLRHGERFKEIPSAINSLDADVVLIQEAFTDRAETLTTLPKFPYHSWGPKARFMRFSSGLLILSRYPIVQTAQIAYSRCGGFDCFANKGAIYVKIRVPGSGDVSVFNTHLNANGHDGVRATQAAHLLRFVRVYSQGLPTIVGGDFNGDGQTLFKKVRQALLLRDAHAEYVGTHPGVSTEILDGYTADPVHNPFLGSSETRRRLDHIFLMNGTKPRNPLQAEDWRILNYALFLDGVHGKVLSDHFGVRVSADLG